MSEEASALDDLTEAAIEWAGGGCAQPIVDAAAAALAAGLDSPSLRMLPGAPRTQAEHEAAEFAPQAFCELGLAVADRLSPEAHIDVARQRTRGFLAGHCSARQLTTDLASRFVAADYASELATWSALGDYYDRVRDGVLEGLEADIDAEAQRAAEALTNGLAIEPVSLGGLLGAPDPAPEGHHYSSWLGRLFRRR